MAQHTKPKQVSKTKIVVYILLLLFLAGCLWQVIGAIGVARADEVKSQSRFERINERATSKCPGGKQHWRRTWYLGDERHAPLRLAEFNLHSGVCYTAKGWIKNAHANVYVHSNGTASTLGYRYELRPGNNARHSLRKHHHKYFVRLTRAASYKQCIPGVPGGVLTCGPDGNFHVEPVFWAKRTVRHNPYVNHLFVSGGIWKDSSYARTFMSVYKRP